MQEVIVTGGLGFIGREIVKSLIQNNIKIHLLVRPDSNTSGLSDYSLINIIEVDLENISGLVQETKELEFDTVFHIAAIRGASNIKKHTYWKVNVEATECLAEMALKRSAKFLFCSSVGVYGTIPEQVPPGYSTPHIPDNIYHSTKIISEKKLNALKEKGLNYCIIRPSITYGTDDYGFPFSLIKMVDKGIFLNSTSKVKINMVDVQSVSQAFINAATYNIKNGSAFDMCDKEPLNLNEIVDFINQALKHKDYPKIKKLPVFIFRLGEYISDKIFNDKTWKTRFQLISRDWYYSPEHSQDELKIIPKETIPNFSYVIEWYKKAIKQA